MQSSFSSNCTGGRLVHCCIRRLILIPLILLCAVPRVDPVFSENIFPFIFILVLGLSNGIFGSVPIIIALSKVEDYDRKLTGNMMALSYNFGLTTGSLVAYYLKTVLAPVEYHPWGPNPLDVKPSSVLLNATWSTASTLSSTTMFDTTMFASISSTVLDSTYNKTFEMG